MMNFVFALNVQTFVLLTKARTEDGGGLSPGFSAAVLLLKTELIDVQI
jgi:hypothetical protein